MGTKFQRKPSILNFEPKFAQKRIFASKFQKYKFGFGISILEILWAPIFRQNGEVWSFASKFAKKWMSGSRYQSLSLDLKSATLRYYVQQFLHKENNFDFLGPNLPNNEIWGCNFKNLSLDLELLFIIICLFKIGCTIALKKENQSN